MTSSADTFVLDDVTSDSFDCCMRTLATIVRRMNIKLNQAIFYYRCNIGNCKASDVSLAIGECHNDRSESRGTQLVSSIFASVVGIGFVLERMRLHCIDHCHTMRCFESSTLDPTLDGSGQYVHRRKLLNDAFFDLSRKADDYMRILSPIEYDYLPYDYATDRASTHRPRLERRSLHECEMRRFRGNIVNGNLKRKSFGCMTTTALQNLTESTVASICEDGEGGKGTDISSGVGSEYLLQFYNIRESFTEFCSVVLENLSSAGTRAEKLGSMLEKMECLLYPANNKARSSYSLAASDQHGLNGNSVLYQYGVLKDLERKISLEIDKMSTSLNSDVLPKTERSSNGSVKRRKDETSRQRDDAGPLGSEFDAQALDEMFRQLKFVITTILMTYEKICANDLIQQENITNGNGSRKLPRAHSASNDKKAIAPSPLKDYYDELPCNHATGGGHVNCEPLTDLRPLKHDHVEANGVIANNDTTASNSKPDTAHRSFVNDAVSRTLRSSPSLTSITNTNNSETATHSSSSTASDWLGWIEAKLQSVHKLQDQLKSKSDPHFLKSCQLQLSALRKEVGCSRKMVESAIGMAHNRDQPIYGTSDSRASVNGGTSFIDDGSSHELRLFLNHSQRLRRRWHELNQSLNSLERKIQSTVQHLEEFSRQESLISELLDEKEIQTTHDSDVVFSKRPVVNGALPERIEFNTSLLQNLRDQESLLQKLNDTFNELRNGRTSYDQESELKLRRLNTRWKDLASLLENRVKTLKSIIETSPVTLNVNDFDMISSVSSPWKRSIASNGYPYFVNTRSLTTTWDHPDMFQIMESLESFTDVRFCAYRTSMKLRSIQRWLCLDLCDLSNISRAFSAEMQQQQQQQQQTSHGVTSSTGRNLAVDTMSVSRILTILRRVYELAATSTGKYIDIARTTDVCLNWLILLHDQKRRGNLKPYNFQITLTLLSKAPIEEKYKYAFESSVDSEDGTMTLHAFRKFISCALSIPKWLGEVAAFGGHNVEPSLQSYLAFSNDKENITLESFLAWLQMEPQSLVWLPVLHRLAVSECTRHEAKCNICKEYPIIGFRYRSLKRFNFDVCQKCFLLGKQYPDFHVDDPLQEYYVETSSADDIRDFFKIFSNKLKGSNIKTKLGYLPLPRMFNNGSVSSSPSSCSLNDTHNTNSSESQNLLHPVVVDDVTGSKSEPTSEHIALANYCRVLSAFKGARERQSSVITSDGMLINDLHQDEINDFGRLQPEIRQTAIDQSPQIQSIQIPGPSTDNGGKFDVRNTGTVVAKDHRHHQFPPTSSRQAISTLFHFANDINRAVDKLVTVITNQEDK